MPPTDTKIELELDEREASRVQYALKERRQKLMQAESNQPVMQEIEFLSKLIGKIEGETKRAQTIARERDLYRQIASLQREADRLHRERDPLWDGR